jgi:hypothetical protein
VTILVLQRAQSTLAGPLFHMKLFRCVYVQFFSPIYTFHCQIEIKKFKNLDYSIGSAFAVTGTK